jgi:hypothetical protein
MKIKEDTIRGIKMVHAIPGRVRLKIDRLKHNPALAEEIRKRFSGIQGILHVEANPLTSSVLLIYDPKEVISLASLGSFLETLTSLFPEVNLEEIKAWLTSPAFISSAAESGTISAFIEAFKERSQELAGGIGQESMSRDPAFFKETHG